MSDDATKAFIENEDECIITTNVYTDTGHNGKTMKWLASKQYLTKAIYSVLCDWYRIGTGHTAVRITALSADPDLDARRTSNDTFLVAMRIISAFILSGAIGKAVIMI